MLGFSVIEPKICQKVGVGRKKSLKTIYYRIACLYDNLEDTGWQVFVTHERADQQSGQEYCLFGSY